MNSHWMRELPPAARYIFQGEPMARAALAAIWGVPLSDVACRASTSGNRAALWLGPEEYLLWESPAAGAADLVAQFEQLQRLHPCSVVDVSHRQISWEISGTLAETILSGACPLDLDIELFPVGMCTRTVLAKAEVLLWRRRLDLFHLEAWRSYSPYVTALLNEIASGYPQP